MNEAGEIGLEAEEGSAVALASAEELVRQGSLLEAIDLLTEANRRSNVFAVEQRLVDLRHQAWSLFRESTPVGDWPRHSQYRLPATAAPPEISSDQLRAETLASAIDEYGCLIVRGLLSDDWCSRLRHDIDRGIDAARDWLGNQNPTASEWFSPFAPAESYLSPMSRVWLSKAATAYCAESPRTLFDLLDAYDDAGIDKLLQEYFGERPAFSLIKSAFRRTPPDAAGGWHQDGYVAGKETRTVNLWVAVSPCGANAPGLDILPRRMWEILPTAKGLPVDFVIPDETIHELARETPIVRPDFGAGDAIFFDQWLPHQTGWGPGLSEARYGFESWFFAPSTFPEMWYPLIY